MENDPRQFAEAMRNGPDRFVVSQAHHQAPSSLCRVVHRGQPRQLARAPAYCMVTSTGAERSLSLPD
jgi:hypothetical protein